MLAAAAWLGCDPAMMDTTSVTSDPAALETASAPGTPGEQTPVPVSDTNPRGHYIYLPPDYDGVTPFPLLVFLHGNGEKGDGNGQLNKVLRHGPPMLIDRGRDFEAIVASPQLATGGWSAAIVASFVDYLVHTYRVDPARIYITGLSLGGAGTWKYGRDQTATPAALVPICGPKEGTGYEVLDGKPVWAFHDINDGTVSIDATLNILREITGVALPPRADLKPGSTYYFDGAQWKDRLGQNAPLAGENPVFTVYSGGGHNAWTRAYNNEAMWTWLFQQAREPGAETVFEQDFNGPAPLVQDPNPGTGQFNHMGAEPGGGTFRVVQGRLELARAGNADGDAGLARWTDFSGPPDMLHIAFDLGASGWTQSTSQSSAFLLAIGGMDKFNDYGNGEVSANTFQTLTVKGEGTGRMSFIVGGFKSALLPADGTLHHVELLLNKSGAAASYRGSDGSSYTLRNNGAALWVNGSPVVVDAPAANGASSALTDFRMRWSTADNAIWSLDNIVIRSILP